MAIGIVPALVFLVLAFVEIDLPGLYMDEAYLDAYTVKMLDRSKTFDRPLFNLPDNVLDKNDRFPVTGGIYVGLIGTYLGLPYYALFGMNIFTLRTYHALYGSITVFLVFLILDRITNRRSAFWGSLLLAVDAGFLVTYRTQGWNVIAPMPFFLLAIYLALPFENDEQPITGRRAFAIGALYGLAGYGYFVYLLFAPPLVIALLLWGRSRITKKAVLSCMLGCLTGYLPLLYALLSIAVQSPQLISTFIERAGSATSFADRLEHIGLILRVTFNNDFVPQNIAGPHHVPFSELKIYIWICLAASVLALCRHKGTPRQKKFLVFCLLAIVCYCLELVKFGNQIAVHHAVIIMPLAYMALATFGSILATAWLSEGIAGNSSMAAHFGLDGNYCRHSAAGSH